MSDTFPVVMTSAGLQPTSPITIRQALIDRVAATNPGYTANLPGSLIEDISSTDVAAIALADAARVELVNSLTPYGANDYLLRQLGNIYGVPLGRDSTTSVLVVFSGSIGFVISAGFTVSDGTYQYVVQTDGIIGAVSEVGVKVPVVVRLEGNNAELGSERLAQSGLNIIAAKSLTDAAVQVVKAAEAKA